MSKMQELIDLIVQTAKELGWSVSERRGKNPLLHAPAPYTNVTIPLPPAGQCRDTELKSIVRKVWRYADADRRLEFARDAALHESELVNILPGIFKNVAPLPHPPAPKQKVTLDEALHQTDVDSAPQPKTLVSEQPWLAHLYSGQYGGRRYPSKVVLERRWSDGSVDYRCAFCGYTRDKPRSIANHARVHGPEPTVAADIASRTVVDAEYLEPMSRRGKRVESMVDKIKAALPDGWQQMDADELAHLLAERLVPERDDEDVINGQHEMTPEEVLRRIRNLVDGGAYLELQRQQDELRVTLEQTRHELADAQNKAQRATDRWRALQDLITAEEED